MNVRSWHTKQEIVCKGHHMYYNKAKTNHLLCLMSKYVLHQVHSIKVYGVKFANLRNDFVLFGAPSFKDDSD